MEHKAKEIMNIGNMVNTNPSKHASELSKILDEKKFTKSFGEFIKQANKNVVSGKSEGGKTPYGFFGVPYCDGARIRTHYGQGAASKTPYFNWWVVSIYYIPKDGNIVLGIEVPRYPHLKEMLLKPSRYAIIGNKKIEVAIFYSTTIRNIDYSELLENFISVSEEVMRLGLR